MEEGAGLVFRGCQLPPGFRFQPTDQEIIVCYLKKKIAGTSASVTSIVADVDIYKFDPWELPEKATFGDGEWFFFSPRERKYPNGARPNRTAGCGYWKATGTDKPILSGAGGEAKCLGVKKALVFYQGRSPKGTKTEWLMHEYRLLDTDNNHHRSSSSMRLDDWVLCRVRNKQGCVSSSQLGPENSSSSDPTISHDEEDMAPPSNVDWTTNDGHLLRYLIGGGGGGGGGCPPDQQEPDDVAAASSSSTTDHHLQVSSVLESIKRKLSFQAIDELYLLQPATKRAANNCIRLNHTDHQTSTLDGLFY